MKSLFKMKELFKKVSFIEGRVLSNTLIQAVGHFFSIIFSIIITYFLTRYLTTTNYGKYSTVFAYLGLFSVIAELGIDRFLVREISQNIKDKKYINHIINNAFLLRIFLVCLFFLLALLFSFVLPYDNSIRVGIFFAFFHYLFFFPSMVFVDYFQANYHFLNNVFAKTLSRLCVLLFILLSISFGIYWQGVVLISSLDGFVFFLLMFFYIKNKLKISLIPDINTCLRILRGSVTIALVTFLNQIYFRVNIPLLSFFQDSTSVGIYSLANKVFETAAIPATILSAALYPLITRKAGMFNKKSNIYRVIGKSFFVLFLAAITISLFIFIFAEKIVFLLGGSEFIKSELPLRILSIALFFVYLSRLFFTILISYGEEKVTTFLYLSVFLLHLFLCLIIVSRFSYVGISYVTLVTQFMLVMGSLILYKLKLSNI